MAEKGTKMAREEAPREVAAARTELARPRMSPVSLWEREIDELFDDFRRRLRWPRLFSGAAWPRAIEPERILPSLDVYEKDDEIIVKAELPGIAKENIEVSLTESTLTVKGEKRQEEEVKEESFYRAERSFGSMARTIALPTEVRGDQAKATFKDGVLEIRLPKTEQARPKSVKVTVQ